MRSNASARRAPRSMTSMPPTPLSGTPSANGSNRWPASIACRSGCCAGSTECATSSSKTRSVSPPGCRPTTSCCGARAAPARAPWSRPPMPRSTRRGPGCGKGRCLLFCDDLSFDQNDTSYKSLKAVLEGGIEGRPGNVALYATSNRRHLMAREMIENESSTAINPGEAVEEKVSLSDRFGLWLGFHHLNQETYLAIVRGYAAHYGLNLPPEQLGAEASEWSITHGSRSGRVAWQFIQDLAGRLGKPLA